MDSVIGRSWRLCATMLLFAVFGLGGVAAACTVLPVLHLAAGGPARRQRWNRHFVRLAFRSFLGLMSAARVCEFDIDGATLAKLAKAQGALVVGNHPTLIDVLILLAYIDQANCVVKSTLWRNPFLLFGIRAANYIPNRHVSELLPSCEAALRRGETLIVFPEATRTVPGQPIRLQRGAANIALRADATIQTLHIDCDPVFLSKEMPWYRVPPRKPCFTIRAGVSLRAGDFLHSGETRTIAARRLTGALTRVLSGGENNGGAGIRAQTASH